MKSAQKTCVTGSLALLAWPIKELEGENGQKKFEKTLINCI